MESNKKILLSTIGIAILIVLVTGVTFAFFNYTRIGASNNIRVGRIYFNSGQTDTISLTNVFPIKSEDLDDDQNNHDSITINITGDTTYSGGIEYLVTFTDVNNTINNKKIPISFSVDSTGIGTNSTNYYNERGGDTSYYFLSEDDVVKENKYIMAGYIAPSDNTINGSITITAFLDADRIAVSDTYSSAASNYALNTNMSPQELSLCVTYVTTSWQYSNDFREGETGEAFCNGTGTSYGATFNETISNSWFTSEDMEYFKSKNIVIDTNPYVGDTTSEWVAGRVVFKTNEWNNFHSNNAISFKVKVEANEGIWVEKEPTPASCFTYSKPQKAYEVNSNLSQEQINACVTYFSGKNYALYSGETYEEYCAGTGTMHYNTLKENVEGLNSFSDITFLLNNNIITQKDYYVTAINDYDVSCGTDVVIPKKANVDFVEYELKSNLTNDEINTCVDYLTNQWGVETTEYDPSNNLYETVQEGESYHDYCAGTGTNFETTMNDSLNDNWFNDEQIEYFYENNIININHKSVNSIIKNVGGLSYKGLTSIDIPNTITTIGSQNVGLFQGNNITSLYIDVDKIPNYFASHNNLSSLTTLVLGNHVRTIEDSAFLDCSLTSVVIPDSVKSIGGQAFMNNQLASVTIGNGITTIPFNSFMNNELTSVDIPSSVKLIEAHAFSNNNLINLVIPNGVETIDTWAFSDNPLKNVVIPNSVTSFGSSSISTDEITTLTIDITNISDDLFKNSNIKNLILGSNVRTIGKRAFQQCKLESVNFGTGVTTIGEHAFRNNSLTSLIIGNSVNFIGPYAFTDNQLTSVTIGNGVNTIGPYAFTDNQLTSVTIGNGVNTIGPYAFLKDAGANANLASIAIDKQCSVIKNMSDYAWIGPSNNMTGTTIYGSNNEVCDSW